MKMQRDVKLCCSADVIVRQQSTTSLYGPAGLCNAQEPAQAAAAETAAPQASLNFSNVQDNDAQLLLLKPV
jgi:hypothetical protein